MVKYLVAIVICYFKIIVPVDFRFCEFISKNFVELFYIIRVIKSMLLNLL